MNKREAVINNLDALEQVLQNQQLQASIYRTRIRCWCDRHQLLMKGGLLTGFTLVAWVSYRVTKLKSSSALMMHITRLLLIYARK